MATRTRTIRRWPEDEVASLIAVLKEIRNFPRPENAMLWSDDEGMLSLEQSEDVSREWERVKSQPLWPKLSRDREFKALQAAFQVNQRGSRRAILPRTEFRFLYNILEGARFFVKWKPTAPDSDERKKAIKLINDLREARSGGVVLSDPGEDATLTRLLDQLEAELISVRRKLHEGQKVRQSRTILRVAYALEIELGGTSGIVLGRFAEFAGIDLDASTIEKILKQAREKGAQFLAALSGTDIPRK